MSPSLKPRSSRSSSKTSEHREHLMGSTVIGERGQVVIPKDIREQLRLKAGDKLMVMVHKDGPIMLLPVEKMQQMVRQMSEQMAALLD